MPALTTEPSQQTATLFCMNSAQTAKHCGCTNKESRYILHMEVYVGRLHYHEAIAACLPHEENDSIASSEAVIMMRCLKPCFGYASEHEYEPVFWLCHMPKLSYT